MSEDYEIKMDGEKAEFEGGAIRYTKTGKGRFDLIPKDVYQLVLERAKDEWFANDQWVCVKPDNVRAAAHSTLSSKWVDTIIGLIIQHYFWKDPERSLRETSCSYEHFLYYLDLAEKELAIHYEKGAEKYGVDNWKNGIPATGGGRGGSFEDSGLRHLNQYFRGETDENHFAAALWNFWCGAWVMEQTKAAVELAMVEACQKYPVEGKTGILTEEGVEEIDET